MHRTERTAGCAKSTSSEQREHVSYSSARSSGNPITPLGGGCGGADGALGGRRFALIILVLLHGRANLKQHKDAKLMAKLQQLAGRS